MKTIVALAGIVTTCVITTMSFRGVAKKEIVELGAKLFSDPVLSKDYTVSCATCHIPAYAFADTAAVSTGVFGRKGHRNSPSAMNVLLRTSLFWDGRAGSLEEQALAPIKNPDEMDLPIDSALMRLSAMPVYQSLFQKAFAEPPNRSNLAAAIAAFERTLETTDSPFDNWKFSRDSNAVSASVKRGFELFNTKGKCAVCHFGADFTANEFRNIGLFDGKLLTDSGRSIITGNPSDVGKFKTPSLRNIAVTGPYMHNGMFRTLDEVIDFYNDTRSVVARPLNQDTLLTRPLGLTMQEKADLKAFLFSVTDKRFVRKTSSESAGHAPGNDYFISGY